jgi:soluble P-type ATPase
MEEAIRDPFYYKTCDYLERVAVALLYNNLMIELIVPGRGVLQLEHLVCSVDGTLALDGQLPEGLSRVLRNLRDRLTIHLLASDTHGKQSLIDQQTGVQAVRLSPGDEAGQKAAYVHRLGAQRVVAIGQGKNDTAMLEAAALGICVLSKEGTAAGAVLAADLLVPDIFSALELLEKPLRIVSSLRS